MDTENLFEEFLKNYKDATKKDSNKSNTTTSSSEDGSGNSSKNNNSNNYNSNNNANSNENSNENKCRFFNNDICWGFQDLNPELFTVMGSILGAVISSNLPFNVQNAIGNWISLLGQTILTYNAQQQYFESGPGKCYNVNRRNIENSDCPYNNPQQSNDESDTKDKTDRKKSKDDEDIKEKLKELEKELENLKNKIQDLSK